MDRRKRQDPMVRHEKKCQTRLNKLKDERVDNQEEEARQSIKSLNEAWFFAQ